MELKKARKSVTPAKAGVQNLLKYWIPAFAGMTKNRELSFFRDCHSCLPLSFDFDSDPDFDFPCWRFIENRIDFFDMKMDFIG